jgi:hypothetical protein
MGAENKEALRCPVGLYEAVEELARSLHGMKAKRRKVCYIIAEGS